MTHKLPPLLTLCVALALLAGCQAGQEQVWKERWEKDTASQEKMIRQLSTQITDLSLDLTVATSTVASATQQIRALEAENDILRAEVTALKTAARKNQE